MYLKCKCGRDKLIPPYRSNTKKKWVCDDCKALMHEKRDNVARKRIELAGIVLKNGR